MQIVKKGDSPTSTDSISLILLSPLNLQRMQNVLVSLNVTLTRRNQSLTFETKTKRLPDDGHFLNNRNTFLFWLIYFQYQT